MRSQAFRLNLENTFCSLLSRHKLQNQICTAALALNAYILKKKKNQKVYVHFVAS